MRTPQRRGGEQDEKLCAAEAEEVVLCEREVVSSNLKLTMMRLSQHFNVGQFQWKIRTAHLVLTLLALSGHFSNLLLFNDQSSYYVRFSDTWLITF